MCAIWRLRCAAANIARGWLRGARSGEYPYPFLDVAELGLSVVLFNALVLLGVFLASGGMLVAVDKVAARRLASARAPT